MLLLDCDVILARDPTFMFSSPGFVKHGNWFWGDVWGEGLFDDKVFEYVGELYAAYAMRRPHAACLLPRALDGPDHHQICGSGVLAYAHAQRPTSVLGPTRLGHKCHQHVCLGRYA